MSTANPPEQFLSDLYTGRELAADNAPDDDASDDGALSDGASAFSTQTVDSAAAMDIYGNRIQRLGTEDVSNAAELGSDVEVVAGDEDVNVPSNPPTAANQDNNHQGPREDTNTSRPHSYASVGPRGSYLWGRRRRTSATATTTAMARCSRPCGSSFGTAGDGRCRRRR